MPLDCPSISDPLSKAEDNSTLKQKDMYEVLTPEIVKNMFSTYNPNLDVTSYTVRSGPAHQHYCSIMYHITAKLKNRKEDGEEITIPVIFKSIPRNKVRAEFILESKFFLKETQMYQEVLPKLTQCSGCKFTSLPKVFDTFSDGYTDYIALEDLEAIGFKIANRLSGLDWDHSVLTVKELAKFHALSFIKYGGDGEKMQEAFPEIKEHFWVHVQPMPEMPQQFISNTMRDIEMVMKEEKLEHYIPRIHREFVDNIFERISFLSSVPTQYPSAFNHGDCWTTNIMYKYSVDGHPEKLKFIDFQKSMVNSRCTDLAYLIYTSVSTQVLNEKLESLLELYYNTFTEFCSQLGAQSPLTFKGHELTWDYFLEEWKVYHHFGLIFGLLLIPLMYATTEDVPDFELMVETDIKPIVDQAENQFSKMWQSRTMREKLINLISKHLPE